MRRAGTLPNTLRLPAVAAPPTATLEIVRGRQRVVRNGIFLTVIAGKRRTVYAQLDGEIILADECKCQVDYVDDAPPHVSFHVRRRFDCPIDEHKRELLKAEQEE